MKRKCSSQKFIIEIYVFLFFTLKNSFSYRERVLLSSRICIPIKKFPIERRQLFVRDSFDYFEFLQKKKKRKNWTCFGNNAGYFQNDRPCTKAVEQQEDRFATRQESLSYVARKADETPRPGISSTLLEHWTHRVIIRSRWTFTFHARFLFPFNNQWEQLYSRHIVVARHFEPNVWIRDEELK